MYSGQVLEHKKSSCKTVFNLLGAPEEAICRNPEVDNMFISGQTGRGKTSICPNTFFDVLFSDRSVKRFISLKYRTLCDLTYDL